MKILVQVQNLQTGETLTVAVPRLGAYDCALETACAHWNVTWDDIVILDK